MPVRRGLLVVFALLLLTGCTATKTSNTARTGAEQLLISNAVDQSLGKINFAPFAGHKVFLEEKYLESVDKPYVLSSIRHRLMRQGTLIVGKPEEADTVLELRSGGIGTDTSDSFLGMPGITLPGMLTLPEVRLVSRQRQTGIAKIGLVAYDAKSLEVLGDGGVSLARSDDNNWYFMGVGPYQNGSVKGEISRGVSSYPGQRVQDLPPYVAFGNGARRNPPLRQSDIQMTSEEEDLPPEP